MKKTRKLKYIGLGLIFAILTSRLISYGGESLDIRAADTGSRIYMEGETGKILLYMYDINTGLLKTYLRSREPFKLRKVSAYGELFYQILMEELDGNKLEKLGSPDDLDIALSFDEYIWGGAGMALGYSFQLALKNLVSYEEYDESLRYTEDSLYVAKQILIYELFQKMIGNDFDLKENGLLLTKTIAGKEVTAKIPKDYYLRGNIPNECIILHNFLLSEMKRVGLSEIENISIQYTGIYQNGSNLYLTQENRNSLEKEVEEIVERANKNAGSSEKQDDAKNPDLGGESDDKGGEGNEEEDKGDEDSDINNKASKGIKKSTITAILILMLGVTGIVWCLKVGKKSKPWKGYKKAKK